jgi:hypothetical protein
VSGFFNEEKFKPPVEPDKKFDARTATFEFPETFSHAIVSLGKGAADSPNMCWAGGFFTAALSWHDLDISWQTSKQGYDDVDYGKNKRGEMNNTTSATSYHDNMTWTGLHVYNMHDGIRTNNTYSNWTVQHVWFDYIRDDCIENDHIYSGTVYDSLFDGCYSGISVRPSSTGTGLGQTITLDKVLMRMEPMPYPHKWDTDDDPVVFVDGYGDVPFGHGNVFKLYEGNEPEFRVTNSVFLHEYDAQKVIFPPTDNVTACNNNTIIWLGDPATAPTFLLDDFPGCFTLIIDEVVGKGFWEDKVADWHASHPAVGANRKPAVPGGYSWPRYAAAGTPAPQSPLPQTRHQSAAASPQHLRGMPRAQIPARARASRRAELYPARFLFPRRLLPHARQPAAAKEDLK